MPFCESEQQQEYFRHNWDNLEGGAPVWFVEVWAAFASMLSCASEFGLGLDISSIDIIILINLRFTVKFKEFLVRNFLYIFESWQVTVSQSLKGLSQLSGVCLCFYGVSIFQVNLIFNLIAEVRAKREPRSKKLFLSKMIISIKELKWNNLFFLKWFSFINFWKENGLKFYNSVWSQKQ